MVQLDMARIIGCYTHYDEGGYHYTSSSGSEHDGAAPDIESLSLSDMVDCFLEESCLVDDEVKNHNAEESEEIDDDDERVDSVNAGLCLKLVSDKADNYRNMLVSQVHRALESTLQFNHNPLRGVMSHLRSLGHNAAVCKTKWDTSPSGGLVSGSHEFIDVVVLNSSLSTRYIIELEFGSKFEIARPTEAYKQLLKLIPNGAIVGKEEEMKKMVKVMSDAAKRSLKKRELHLPPWRKNRYMQMKWFGSYKRTTNAFPEKTTDREGMWKAECRALVGFNPVCLYKILE